MAEHGVTGEGASAPVVTADSLVSFIGTLFWQRTDNPWGDGKIDAQVMATADGRAKAWDSVIEMIEEIGSPDKAEAWARDRLQRYLAASRDERAGPTPST